MFPIVEPRQRPERFLLNRFSPLAESAVFLGLGGFDAAGSVWYPDAMRLLGAVPNDGTLTNMDPATDWVWVPELGRWATDHAAASTQYIPVPGITTLTPPFSVSAWFNVANVTADHCLFSIADGASTISYHMLRVAGTVSGDPVEAQTRAGGDPVIAKTTTSVVSGSWNHACGVWAATNSRFAYLNGGGEGSNASDLAPTLTRSAIGVLWRSGPANYLTGQVSDVIIWNRVLSPAEIAILANPADPMLGGWIVPPHRTSFPAAVAEGGDSTIQLPTLALYI